MSASYDHEALWIKAKMFLNRAMDDDGTRSFDEQALWASAALELLGKAALARVSPLLVADPSEDGTNLLIASGLIEGEARFTSVRAKTLYARCHKAFRPFNASEATKITNARNEYVHGPGTGFLVMPALVWWPRFWALAVILVSALERNVEDLVGEDRTKVVTAHLEQNKRNVEDRTEMLISRAKQRLAQHRSGTLPAKVAGEWRPGVDRTAGLQHQQLERCPACNQDGVVEGDAVSNVETEWQEIGDDELEMLVTLKVDAEYFSCPTCGLVLDGYELIEQAGVNVRFLAEGDSGDVYYESEYANE